MAAPVITCEQVDKRFRDVLALDSLSFDVSPGVVTGYLGSNGAGKSTTIRILLDLARPTGGHVRVFGSDPRVGGPDLRRRIGYLPGELRLDDRLRVDETLRAWARMRGGVDAAYVDHLCERVGLDPTRHTRTLSTGNRRKVGLVGAFMARPDLLVLDEPTAGVDPLIQAEILGLVTDACGEGRTVFFSSHVLSDVQRIADEVIVIRAGRVVAQGKVEELRSAARQEFRVWFDGPAPEAELREASGISGLQVQAAEASGIVEGDVNGLISVLVRHPVKHLLLPEPDLEQAFLRMYDEPAASRSGTTNDGVLGETGAVRGGGQVRP